MTDCLTPQKRSWLMSQVPSKDTTTELIVRRLVHSMGYRYRLHGSDLPGKPDIVLPKYKKIILVHGCFWHRHKGCRKSGVPKSKKHFWLDKFEKNIRRDAKEMRILKKYGWRILVVWQCQTKDNEKLKNRLNRFLNESYNEI
jgi:DNA mismatch endonuclease (patch repair protein)